MMNPEVESWLLAFPYLVVILVFLFMAWAAGGFFYALAVRKVTSEPRPWYYHVPGMGLFFVVMRVAAGLAVFSWAGALLGVTGWFNKQAVLGFIIALVISGWYVGNRFGPLHRVFLVRDRLTAAQDWARLSRGERGVLGLFLLVFCAVAVNAVIGALYPDMNHDPMWYHLPIPQQWAFSGRFSVLPSSLHSVTALAAESLFALIMLVNGDTVMCTLLVAACGVASLVSLGAAGWTIAASDVDADAPAVNPLWAPGIIAGICVPLMAMYGLMAPVQTKNDMVMYIWAAAGTLMVAIPLLGARQLPATGWWITAGFIMGTAVAAKVSALVPVFFTFVLAVGVGAWALRGDDAKPARVAVPVLAGGAALLLALAPWLYRGWTGTGVPLYPLGMKWFPIRDEVAHIHRNWSSIQSVPGAGAAEWLDKLRRFPELLTLGAHNGEKLIFVYLLAMVAALLLEKGRWLWVAVILLGQLVMPVGMKGAVEIYRLFSPCYFLLCLLLARLALRMLAQLGGRKGNLYILALGMMSVACLVEKQARIARFKTMQWEFRPVLSEKDRDQYAAIAEKGASYREMGALRSYVQPGERVLLLGYNYPYFLHRDTLWNDESVGEGGVANRWNGMTPGEVRDFLRSERIDVVLINEHGSQVKGSATARQSEAAGVLERSPMSEELTGEGWAMYRAVE